MCEKNDITEIVTTGVSIKVVREPERESWEVNGALDRSVYIAVELEKQ